MFQFVRILKVVMVNSLLPFFNNFKMFYIAEDNSWFPMKFRLLAPYLFIYDYG